MATENYSRIVKTITFNASGVTDLKFNVKGDVSYRGNTVAATDFNYLYIENKSNFAGSYCIDDDNAITVDGSGNDAVKSLGVAGAATSIISEDNISFGRLRIFLAGAGDVEIIVAKQERG